MLIVRYFKDYCKTKFDRIVGVRQQVCRADMYAGRVACCPLVSHGEYDDGTDARPFTLCFPLWTQQQASISNQSHVTSSSTIFLHMISIH